MRSLDAFSSLLLLVNTFIEGDTDAPSGESREPLRQEAAAEAKAEAGPAVDGTPTTPVPQHQIGKEPIEVLDDGNTKKKKKITLLFLTSNIPFVVISRR